MNTGASFFSEGFLSKPAAMSMLDHGKSRVRKTEAETNAEEKGHWEDVGWEAELHSGKWQRLERDMQCGKGLLIARIFGTWPHLCL